MKRSAAHLCLLLAIACGQGQSVSPPLRVGLQGHATQGEGTVIPLSLNGGESKTLALLALGSTTSAVAFFATSLPAFATLEQALLTLSPSRAEAGTYSFTITVTDGRQTANQPFELTVARRNEPPRWFGFEQELGMVAGPLSVRNWSCPSPTTCTLEPDSYLLVMGCDPDADDLTYELAVVPHGSPIGGPAVATVHQQSARGCDVGLGVNLRIPALQPGVVYDFAVRLTDSLGATATVPDRTDAAGWVRYDQWGFQQGPCPEGTTCACLSSQKWCMIDLDCCSGRCAGSPGFLKTCQ
jgi:hypothetical protein